MNIHTALSFEELSHAAFAAGIAAQPLKSLFEHWDSLRGITVLPERRQFRPERLPRALVPHIGLVKVVRQAGTLAFEYRIIGSAMNPLLGHEPTRLTLSEHEREEYGHTLHLLYSLAVQTHAAIRWDACNVHYSGEERCVRRLCLPLAEPAGGPVGYLLFSSVAETLRHGERAEDFRGDTIMTIAARRPVQVCARRPPPAIAA